MRYLISLLCFLFLTCLPVLTQENLCYQILESRGELVLKFAKPANIGLARLTRQMSIDKYKNDTITAYFNKNEFESFLKLGISYTIFEKPRVVQSMASGNIWSWNKYPTYDEYIAMMDSFARAYPSLCKIENVGFSVENRKILFARISSNTSKVKPSVMYTSSIHGDETGGYILMLRLCEYLLKNYGKIDQVTRLVDSLDIWINPLANPDGTYRLDPNSVNSATRFNKNGVDLNRNFPDPNGQVVEYPVVQQENKVMINLMKQRHFVLSANFHGGAEVVNYPWDALKSFHIDNEWFRYISLEYAELAQKYGRSNYFTYAFPNTYPQGITNGYDWYPVFGGRQDYITYNYQGRELTIELDENKTTPEADLPNLWNYNYRSLLNLLGQGMYGIHGCVTDAVTGKPITTKIELVGHDDTTSYVFSDSLSGFYTRLINTGTYTVRFSAVGYDTKEIENVSVTNNQTSYLNAQLTYNGKSSVLSQNESEIDIYPNPCHDYINIKSSKSGDYKIALRIYSFDGKLQKPEVLYMPNNKIDIKELNAGMYYLELENSKNNKVLKFIKE